MQLQRTLSIIKPDATKRNITGRINTIIEDAGLTIVAQKKINLSKAQAENFYAVHKERPFYGELVDSMLSGPVVVQVYQGKMLLKNTAKLWGQLTQPKQKPVPSVRSMH